MFQQLVCNAANIEVTCVCIDLEQHLVATDLFASLDLSTMSAQPDIKGLKELGDFKLFFGHNIHLFAVEGLSHLGGDCNLQVGQFKALGELTLFVEVKTVKLNFFEALYKAK